MGLYLPLTALVIYPTPTFALLARKLSAEWNYYVAANVNSFCLVPTFPCNLFFFNLSHTPRSFLSQSLGHTVSSSPNAQFSGQPLSSATAVILRVPLILSLEL